MDLKAIAIVVLLASATATPRIQAPETATTRQAVVHSPAELDRYLQATADSPSPLDRLSPLTRKRFLKSLRFKDGALLDYSPVDLAAELTADEIRQVLGIFGEEPYEYLLEIARPTPRTTAPHATPSAIEQRFDAFRRIADARNARSERDNNQAIAKAYDELFAQYEGKARELGDYDLEFVYRAVETTAFYNPTPRYAHSTRDLLAEMQSRKLSRRQDIDSTYRALIGARLFDEARGFAEAHPSPDRRPLPQLHDAPDLASARPTIWAVSPDQRELTRQMIDLQKPAQVIVVSGPGCHFSQDAARAIRNDPTLARLFREHATWLNAPLGQTDFDAVQAWNREHPGQAMVIAYAKEDWPMFDNWGTPIFYIFKDGQLAETVTGWPAREGPDALVKALEKVGLLRGDKETSSIRK